MNSPTCSTPPVLTGIAHQVCAWCGKNMGDVPCVPEANGKITHTICPECAADVLKDDQLSDTTSSHGQ